jgi:hypothetical protein
MPELLSWLTKYSPTVVLLMGFGAALLFFIKMVLERSIASYVDEKVRALKYQRYFAYAQGILRHTDAQKTSTFAKRLTSMALVYFFESDKLKTTEKALGVIAELARNYPYRTQDIIDEICLFVGVRWSKDRNYEERWGSVLVTSLRILASFPKRDQNDYPYYVQLSGLRFTRIDLKGINFENFVLWETDFVRVNMTRSNFRNTDLGGCIFTGDTSVEWSDFAGALMNVAFNGRVTTFDRVLLWGAEFEESRIDKCKMIISDGFDSAKIKTKFGDRLEILRN